MKVSIHAPLRDATQQLRDNIHFMLVSIHAPLRDATFKPGVSVIRLGFQSTRPCGTRLFLLFHCLQIYRFNPRAPAGRDVLSPTTVTPLALVSIHAPLRDATPASACHWLILSLFQSTRPCGTRQKGS